MTFLLLPLLILLLVHKANAQFLQVNGAGKCEMAEVIIADGFSRPTLYSNELKWFKSLAANEGSLSAVALDSIEGKTSGIYEFLVYSQSGILKKIAGSVSYNVNVEVKEGKYRYTFSNFVFHYYAQDRNYKMVKTGKTKPMEDKDAVGWQKTWTAHRKTVFTKVNVQINDLKTKIVEVPGQNTGKEEKKVEW